MSQPGIRYQDMGYFPPLIVDYLNEEPAVRGWYNRFPHIDHFEGQIAEKQNFPMAIRRTLVDALRRQYQHVDASLATWHHIEQLELSTTFTVTTGHQLNLFTGPMYFIYKIASAVNLAKELKARYPQYNFVPVYWMATEDHDFEEINHFTYKGKKFQWPGTNEGPVGRRSTEGLHEVYERFALDLGPGERADFLRALFKKAYLEHGNLTEATRYLANELFKSYGLVIVDGDDAELKKLFAPYAHTELVEQRSFKTVTDTIAEFDQYKVQVNPREINLFYMTDVKRERLVATENGYALADDTKSWSAEELFTELETNPERFSPNVILRPLYQEVILPNLCYIGGGGEIAYWLELKRNFDAFNVVFPMLLIRNGALASTTAWDNKRKKLQLEWSELFASLPELIRIAIARNTTEQLDLSAQKEQLNQLFAELKSLAEQTDKSFINAVVAQETKQVKGLEKLEKRLLKAHQRKYHELTERVSRLKMAHFPGGGLQERKANFAEFYQEAGDDFLPKIFERFRPLEQQFDCLIW